MTHDTYRRILRRHSTNTRSTANDSSISRSCVERTTTTGFTDTVRKTALSKVKQYGEVAGVLQAEQEHIDHLHPIQSLYLDPTVTDDYGFDTTIDPDLKEIRQYVTKTWEIPEETVNRAFERFADSTPLSL